MTRPLWRERAQGGAIELLRSDADSVLARGIAGEVREAMLNLIQNALDAMPGGGTLSITTAVRLGEACIEVSDTGAGMTDEVRDRAFEPFFTTKGTRGTGLGLSEVYGIMKRHRGGAEIESSPGAGTTVRLSFPLANQQRILEPDAPQHRQLRRILLVEDNDEGRAMMCELLTTEGHTVECVTTVAGALVELSRGGGAPPFDLLLTDIGLPDGNGWDLAGDVHRRWPQLRIGVVTGWEGRPTAIEGVSFVLRKPVRTEELLDHISSDE